MQADDSRQREFTGDLNVYYDEVIACIRDAETILIFGPGEAKGELKKRLEKNRLGERIAAVETVEQDDGSPDRGETTRAPRALRTARLAVERPA